jgi:demethylmenaquinone methyltransferase / 2-methoxy-6-polyprenyl-1,4-benzoquinol methylase
MAMPFDNASFDGATMGFSLRNVVDVDATLREILRVLRPGSRFVSLDVTKARNRAFKRLFDCYFYGVVPFLGGIVGGSKAAYSYLPSSLTHHPNAVELRERFARAGFERAGYASLMGGAIAVHYGTKPAPDGASG